MDDWLTPIIYHVGSGNVFFYGSALVVLGITLSPRASHRWISSVRNLAILLGGIFVAISATPLSWWSYSILGSMTLLWFVAEMIFRDGPPLRKFLCRASVAAVWLIYVGIELTYHVMPILPPLGNPTFFLIGDSVSAGMIEADEGSWPKLLAAEHSIDVRDFSRMGATVASARKQAKGLGDETGLVLLEIGGNDLLGATTPDQFAERLDLLLQDVCRKERTVVVLELPLMPFANRFGMIQRQLAAQYDVILIPKRFFIEILTTTGATVDGIHLSRTGHVLMADAVWELIRPAYSAKK